MLELSAPRIDISPFHPGMPVLRFDEAPDEAPSLRKGLLLAVRSFESTEGDKVIEVFDPIAKTFLIYRAEELELASDSAILF